MDAATDLVKDFTHLDEATLATASQLTGISVLASAGLECQLQEEVKDLGGVSLDLEGRVHFRLRLSTMLQHRAYNSNAQGCVG